MENVIYIGQPYSVAHNDTIMQENIFVPLYLDLSCPCLSLRLEVFQMHTTFNAILRHIPSPRLEAFKCTLFSMQ